jgi:thiamine-monophosphate kinase
MTTPAHNEENLLNWLAHPASRSTNDRVLIGPGDDMAAVDCARFSQILCSTDMILEGTHFESDTPLNQVGHKAIAAALSDCAAMAVKPLALLTSIAVPTERFSKTAQPLMEALTHSARRFGCSIIGGDTTAWHGPLAIDVSVLATPWPDVQPVRRDGASSGDALVVTGSLGGSIAGHHLTFEPQIALARDLARTLGPALHAMIDLTDGLSIDLHRLCQASQCGATLKYAAVLQLASAAALDTAPQKPDAVLRSVLGDGEDFELLMAIAPDGLNALAEAKLPHHIIGHCTAGNMTLSYPDGQTTPLEYRGFVHGDRG